MESDDIDSLPMDEHEQFVASEFSNLQKVVKKKASAQNSQQVQQNPQTHIEGVQESRLVRDLKIVLISTVLFLLIGHPKVDSALSRFKLDTLTLYTIKASVFAIILFILINRAC
jgi:hypothetical protein